MGGEFKRKRSEWLLPGEVDVDLPGPIRRCYAESRERCDDYDRLLKAAEEVAEDFSDEDDLSEWGAYHQC